MPRSHALILIALLCSYIVAAALDGGTQVISFILNFAVFGASGTPHSFPDWWGNDLNLSADRCALPDE